MSELMSYDFSKLSFQKRRVHCDDFSFRLFINPHGGIELDKQGRRKKRWQWFYNKGLSQAPAFQPICIQLNKYLSLRLLNQVT